MNTGFQDVMNLLNTLRDRGFAEEWVFMGKAPGDRMTYYVISEKGLTHLKAISKEMSTLSRVIDFLKEDSKSL